jgi:proteasome lid subunit RPN8/RPN11
MPPPLALHIPGLGPGRKGTKRGELHDDAPLILVEDSLLTELLIEYSAADLTRERGAFLLGKHFTAEGRDVVEIRHFLPADQTRSAAASLTFTHDTWATLRREAEARYPDEQLVGWHHTHPGLGVFLSAYDRFLHRHFFSQPWQVALVVDPRRYELGFFEWRRGEIVNCGFVCLVR